MRILAVPFAVLALHGFQSAITPLPPAVKKSIVSARAWQPGCPVPLSGLRLLTVTYRGFDDRPHTGQIVVFFVMAVAAAEAAVGLALFVAIYRQRRTIDLNRINLMRW